MTDVRKIELKYPSNDEPSKTGYFHGFFTEAHYDGAYSTSKPVAVIEYENGEVKVVNAERIRFTTRPQN